jgi:starvation-inducible DNA-binding protein
MTQATFFGHNNSQVTFQPNIGLDASVRQCIVEMLNLLLADEAVLSLKMGRIDTHPGGVDIPDLLALYDNQQKQVNAISIEMIERIHILGGKPLAGSEKSIIPSRLRGELNAIHRIVSVLADMEAFIRFLREDAQKCSEIYEDQGTYALLVSIMSKHEKMAWMLRAYIEPELTFDEKPGV